MFPLTEFPVYADLVANPEYAFTNPLAIEFGFWGFLIWSFYFLTCFYFCVIEPKVGFFNVSWVKFVNNIVIIGTCAFTAYLLLSNLPWYVPELLKTGSATLNSYLVVFAVIAASVYSSTDIRYVKRLSLASTIVFIGLILIMAANAVLSDNGSAVELAKTFLALGGYFEHLPKFALPINDYHQFYLYWWFAWSIMIGQFTARFVSGLRAYQLLIVMMIFPSVPIAVWFTVLYFHHLHGIQTAGFFNFIMALVGVMFVVNSLDSLIRLYTDNLSLNTTRLGKTMYFLVNFIALSGLTLLFTINFLQIQWVGALVIGLMFTCLIFILLKRRKAVVEIEG
jgi:choline-glycine betaine transporter